VLQVLVEQLTSSPWNNILFLFYYGYIVESKCACLLN
jgi:peroxisomal membrane protein 2